jgi:hypothetical protein
LGFVAAAGSALKSRREEKFHVKVMNAAYLAGFLRREDEKLEAAQVRRIIAAP